MSEEQPENHGIISQHRFMLLIGLTIMISVFLVGVALALYASSGAAQLDLSRPGYVSVRDQAQRSNSFDGFSASGTLDKAAIDEFRTMYTQQQENATNVDSFAGDVMSDKSLSIDAPK
ncbi:MAG: hypothetical protein HZB75_00440 [Candidatus Saccharibacteria bacterium]|jgi:hypothetical protein|nr:MAG: hypothetical protein HZB75_00440 [Candidatus Saccharibacteria bacterium]